MSEGVRAEVGYIAPVEGLRGVAVLWVVAFHYVTVRGPVAAGDPWIAALGRVPALDALVRNGYLGVDLFFLISGFLLALPWFAHARSAAPAPSTAAFYARRVRRIVPAYYLQLVMLFALVMPLLHGRGYWRSDLWVDLWNAAAHALFLQNTTPLTSGSLGVNGALWTLAVEAQFYLLLPLAAPLFVRAPLRALAASALASLLWAWAAAHGFRGLVEAMRAAGSHWQWTEETVRRLLAMQLPQFLGHFALGIVLGRAWLMRRTGAQPTRIRLARAFAALAALVLLYAAVTRTAAPEALRPLAALALGALLYLAATSRSPVVLALLGRGPLAHAGRVSYSAYLYHLPLLALSNAFARDWSGPLALPAFAALLFAVAWVSWRYVEQPFLARPGPAARPIPARAAASPD